MLDKKNIPSAYAEVLAFIDAIGDYYRNQIPKDVLDNMERKKDPDAHFKFHASDTDVNFSREALALIAGLNLSYWCHDEQEKKRLREIYSGREIIPDACLSEERLKMCIIRERRDLKIGFEQREKVLCKSDR